MGNERYRPDSQLSIENMEQLVLHALAGKYPVSDDILLNRRIKPIFARLLTTKLADLLAASPVPVLDVEDDVSNQAIALICIDADWAKRSTPNLDLETIHWKLYGTGSPRVSKYVKDFGGEPPTALADIPNSLREINRSLRDIDNLRNKSLDERVQFVASLFAKIIASHVFEDGNGRVARMAVQYCFRRWYMDFLPLPKVRRAPGWQRALHAAMAGNMDEFKSYFTRLIRGETVAAVEQSLSQGG